MDLSNQKDREIELNERVRPRSCVENLSETISLENRSGHSAAISGAAAKNDRYIFIESIYFSRNFIKRDVFASRIVAH